MLAIGAIELFGLLAGFSPSSSVESALSAAEVPDGPELAAPDVEPGALGPLSGLLGWMSVGRVPILVLLVVFLTSFGLSGYIVQWLTTAIFGWPLDAWVAAIPAFVGGLYGMRHIGRWLGRIIPREHSEAASQRELVGSYATIIRGEARRGLPAEAKTTDLRGRSHYVLIEPDDETITYGAGDRVFLVGRNRNVYRAVTRVNTQQIEE